MPTVIPRSKSMKPLPLQEKEYRSGLSRIERRAIIPLKWITLLVTAVLWFGLLGRPLTLEMFMLFLFYLFFNCAETYFFYFSRVTLGEIRPLTLSSYLVDVVFVSILIYLDLTGPSAGIPSNDQFYLLFFLLVMRGFALFKTVLETAFVNVLISLLYILIVYLTTTGLDRSPLMEPDFAVSLILVWLVILMSWFIMVVITKQKSEMLEVHDRLLRTDNLARVGELAAGVAHEINNPIGIIAITAEYLKRRTAGDDERQEDLEAIRREAMRCKEIVQDLLTFANPRPVGVTVVEPRVINDEVLNFVFPSGRTGSLTLIRQYDDDPPPIEADPNLLKQALLNIYLNARQAVPKDRPGRIISRIRTTSRGRMVGFEVEDNGVGIKDEDLENIFEPFFTRKASGTGLGLAVTQRIVEIHKGSISVRPAPQQGTVFLLEFPAVKG
jgi:signal transduction histidine kinase